MKTLGTTLIRRYSYVAGYFYESDPDRLRKQIEWCYKHELGPGDLPKVSSSRNRMSLGYVSPHAGYMYSGPIAAHVYYNLAKEGAPRTVIIIGPNHTGLGTAVATMLEGVWVTPLGEVEVDSEITKILVKESSYLDISPEALMYEHSIEVQLPFLQHIFNSNFKIVPIVMALQTPETARDLADALYRIISMGIDVVVIATTDWTHYEPYEDAKRKDLEALKYVENVDPDGLYNYIVTYNVSACGFGAVMTLLYLAKKLGYGKAVVLKYANSGDVTGRKDSVVGYAAIRVPIE